MSRLCLFEFVVNTHLFVALWEITFSLFVCTNDECLCGIASSCHYVSILNKGSGNI